MSSGRPQRPCYTDGAVTLWQGDARVLEFDHINDDGGEDRRRFKGARPFLDYYGGHPDEARTRLQVLCRNCNWLKRKGYEWGGATPKAGGRLLDGREYSEFPQVLANITEERTS